MSTLVRELFAENPMMNEAQRAVRRFMHTSNARQQSVSRIALYFLGFIYLWLLIISARTQENLTSVFLLCELTLITLVIPGSIYNAISGEREKATWEALILTRLTPAQIIFGKLFWRVCIALGIMAIFLLPIGVTQIFGTRGTVPTALGVLMGQLVVFTWGLLLCCYGFWVSSRTRRSVTTIAIIIGTLLFTLILLPSLLGLFGSLFSTVSYSTTPAGGGGYDDPSLVATFFRWFSDTLTLLNPYPLIGKAMEGKHDTPSNGLTGFNAMGIEAVTIGVVVYLVGIAAFILMTYARLRQLESPQRTDK